MFEAEIDFAGGDGLTGGDERTPFQMGTWVSFHEISRVRSRHVLSCDYSGIRKAGGQAAVHYHRSRVPHRLAGPILGV